MALRRDTGSALSADLMRAARPGDHRPPVPPACSPFEKVGEKRVLTTIATAVARNDVKVKVDYHREASSELTTGLSTDGSLAVAPAGNRSRTSGHGAEWEDKAKPGETKVRQYRVQWLHSISRRVCAKDFRGNYDGWRMTSPDRTTGGVQAMDSKKYKAWTCKRAYTVPAGADSVETENEKAYTYVKSRSPSSSRSRKRQTGAAPPGTRSIPTSACRHSKR